MLFIFIINYEIIHRFWDSVASHMHWPHEKSKFQIQAPLSKLNLSSIEHVWVEYHVAKSGKH
jgi:hypothetical protein